MNLVATDTFLMWIGALLMGVIVLGLMFGYIDNGRGDG